MPDAVKQNDRTVRTRGCRSGGRSQCRLGRPSEILLGFITFVVLFYLVVFKSGFARSVVGSFLAFPARRRSNAWMPRAASARAGAISAVGLGCVLIVAHAFAQGAPRPAPPVLSAAVDVEIARVVAETGRIEAETPAQPNKGLADPASARRRPNIR
jgi:hypothetical protein